MLGAPSLVPEVGLELLRLSRFHDRISRRGPKYRLLAKGCQAAGIRSCGEWLDAVVRP